MATLGKEAPHTRCSGCGDPGPPCSPPKTPPEGPAPEHRSLRDNGQNSLPHTRCGGCMVISDQPYPCETVPSENTDEAPARNTDVRSHPSECYKIKSQNAREMKPPGVYAYQGLITCESFELGADWVDMVYISIQ
ncbi:hypothetical protein BS47DRAFT_1357632 [Hydnum rufescens UP504]|uniref:Uncharacterized protein n=1 Tax=Hydnum rufescens UP504 TaxID=1448309 RepID=A0A9P6B9U8_9AGAM|nr:hypothetical protein BS47DRAFT_1357632 [Hydnum rufescens UP504]